jgi:hypothetical protein
MEENMMTHTRDQGRIGLEEPLTESAYHALLRGITYSQIVESTEAMRRVSEEDRAFFGGLYAGVFFEIGIRIGIHRERARCGRGGMGDDDI